MKKRVLIACVMIMLVTMINGCKKPPPPAPPPPPPPSMDQIYNDISGCIKPLQDILNVPASVSADGIDSWKNNPKALSEKDVSDFLNKVREAKNTPIKATTPEAQSQEARENAQDALRKLAQETETLIGKSRKQERWMACKASIDAFEILEPGEKKYAKLKELAQLHIDRPKVRVRGFFDDLEKNDVYVFMEVFVPKTKELKSGKIRVGEEFMGLRLDSIVGKRKGIKLEYMAIPGEMFEAMAP